MANLKYNVAELDDGGRRFTLRNDVMLETHWGGGQQVKYRTWRNDYEGAPDVGDLFKSKVRRDYVKDNADALFADLRPMESESEAERKAKIEKRKTFVRELTKDLESIAILINTPTSSGQSMQQQMSPSSKNKPDVTERLVRYGRNGAEFFHTPDDKAYAAVRVGAHVENYEIKRRGGGDFGFWLEQEYWSNEQQRLQAQSAGSPLQPAKGQEPLPDVIRDRDLNDALRLLRGYARFKGEEREVYRRVAGHGDKIYVDLCNDEWRVIEVDGEGYRVIPGDDAPVRFARTPGMLPLPEPVSGGSLQPLRNLLHLGDGVQGDRNWRLIVAWLVQGLSPFGAYGILSLFGNQGSGKTDTQRVLRGLVDPHTTPVRSKPREERDVFIAASNAWCISLDNMSKVPEWLSNVLCIIATHGSYGLRRNYEDDEETLFSARRPILINGIGDILQFPDLLDRAAIVRLPPFGDEADAADSNEPSRRLEDNEVLAIAAEIAPGVLGALLDCLSYYLSVRNEIPNPRTRMVTYAKIGVAVERYLQWGDGAFMRAYRQSRGEASAQVLDAHPVSDVLIDFAQDYPEDDPWESTPRELLDTLNKNASQSLRESDGWPSGSIQLGTELNAIATNLREKGVVFERFFAHKSKTMYRVFKLKKSES